MYAAKYNKVAILKLLSDNGANLSARSQNGISNVTGKTAYDFAKSSNAAFHPFSPKNLLKNPPFKEDFFIDSYIYE